MLKEFKEFIAKGNVLDLAIGLIMGSAFTAIVTSLVEDIISPFIGLIIGEADFSQLVLNVGSAQVKLGNFINAIINFIIVAFILFLIIKGVNKFRNNKPEEVEEEAPSNEEVLLTEIRDLLRTK